MNYTEIKQLSLDYADRYDAPINDNLDNFLQIVESRINKLIKVGGLTIRTTIKTTDGQEYYGLPDDYSALRDIEMQDKPVPPALTSTNRQTLQFRTPQQFNDYVSNTVGLTNKTIVYTVIAGNQLQIYPPQDDKIMEIVYYQKLPPLSASQSTNWISDNWPEVYLHGMQAEINSFVKDPVGYSLWDNRFMVAVDSITKQDSQERWSGVALQIRN